MTAEAAAPRQDVETTSINFSFSSYVEMVLSLHVLCDPQRHGMLLPWFVRFKEKISPEAYEHIFAYGEALGGWMRAIAPVLRRTRRQDLGVAAVLHDLETWRPGRFAEAFSGRSEEWKSFIRFLWTYWTEYFHEEFYWIEPLLVSSIRQQAPAAGRDRVAFLEDLAPEVTSEVEKLGPRPDGVEVRLLPSVFAMSGQVLASAEGMVTGCYAVSPGIYRKPESLEPPEPLARLLKTLADETRLKILKLILEEHRCARDLADELELAEPTMSRHLRRLRDAELVDATEQGNFVYYTARLERIAELQMKVLDFLRS